MRASAAVNLRQIEAFRAVVETGSVSQAADRLALSQPAVSKSVAAFEGQIGFPVFERRRGRLIPTAEALLLYDEVARVLSGIDTIAQANSQWVAAVNSDYKLVLSSSDKPWLFDLENDPDELTNYYHDPQYLQTGNRPGVFCRLPLSIIKVGGYRNDRFGNLFTQVLRGIFNQLAQHLSRDFLGGQLLAIYI